MARDDFKQSKNLMISILDNAVKNLRKIKNVTGKSPYARMQDERRAKAEFNTTLTNLGRTLGQQVDAINILDQLVSAIEIQRGERAISTALKIENEIDLSFTQYDPRQLGFTLKVDLRDVMDREREERRSNPYWI